MGSLKMIKKKAVVYLRVNKEDLANQLTEVNNFCRDNNIEITKEYIDQNCSSLNYNRPELNKLKNVLINNCEHIEFLLIYSMKGLGSNLEKNIMQINEWELKNLKVIFVKNSRPTYEEIQLFIRSLLFQKELNRKKELYFKK
jgi:DNA invertase Pin-like site-specific DNA recombinase